jgi:hypothetical protein
MTELSTLCKQAQDRLAGLCADYERMSRELQELRQTMEHRQKEIFAARGVVAGIKMAMGEEADSESVPEAMRSLKLQKTHEGDDTGPGWA